MENKSARFVFINSGAHIFTPEGPLYIGTGVIVYGSGSTSVMDPPLGLS